MKLGTVLGHTQACLTTTLAWTLGPKGDPALTIPVSQLSDWQDLWCQADPALQERIRLNWPKTLSKILKAGKGNRWNMATGPMSGTINTLIDLGWSPVQPNNLMAEPGL